MGDPNKEYFDYFKGSSTEETKEIRKRAFEEANKNLKSETKVYWQRANYFWLFQASVYAGYFYCITAKNKELLWENPGIIIGVTCLGFLTALTWLLSNIGSKRWHGHWLNHVYKLEDGVTGPLYKIRSSGNIWSVTKINELLSEFSIIVWVLLGLKTVHIFYPCNILAYTTYILILVVISFVFKCRGKSSPYKKPDFFKEGEG